jgi:hypothetical protein
MDKRGDVKKNIVWVLLLLSTSLFFSYAVYSALCGGTSCVAGTNIGVSNSKPNITNVESPGTTTLVAGTTKEILVYFNATDPNGKNDIDKSKANASVFKSGQTTRYNYSCINVSEQENTIRFKCAIQLYFYDGDGTWTVNVSAFDNSGARDINQTITFSVNTLDDVDIDDATINWANIPPNSNDNQGDAITFTNKGNQDYASINVTGKNATSGANNIPSTQFAIDVDAAQTSGQTYLDETQNLEWTGASLSHGAAETEVMYTYVDIPANQPSGTYTSVANWDMVFI